MLYQRRQRMARKVTAYNVVLIPFITSWLSLRKMLFASSTNNSDAGQNVTVLGVSCVCVRVFSFSIIESRHNAKDLCVKRRAFYFKSNERVKQSSNPIRQLIFVRAKSNTFC